MAISVLHVPAEHPLNGLSESLKQQIVEAQTNDINTEFSSAYDFCQRALSDLKIAIQPLDAFRSQPAAEFGEQSAKELQAIFSALLTANGVPEQAVALQATNLTHRVQLLRGYRDPDRIVSSTCDKVVAIVRDFPQRAEDIRVGRNPGDVLDPYILGAVQILMCAGDFEHTISATVTHKILMIIEGLLGHLHEDVIGAMRGNVRAPEPGGEDKEVRHPLTNPFPGADVVQPPLADRPLRFHQLKAKTGSAKGGDGRRLGLQLANLTQFYGGEAYYDALVGNTLRGHRSRAGVQRGAPTVVVLVGQAACRVLTGSSAGPQLLLRLYQSTFEVASRRTGYSFQNAVAAIYHAFQERAAQLGEGFLEAVLHDAIAGDAAQQDSRLFTGRRRRQGGADAN